MAIDLNAIRAKLTKMQATTNSSTHKWKPVTGENVIRIVPYQFDKANPFIELYFHYNLGKKNHLSLATFGEPDPIVEFAEKLATTGEKSDWVISKKLEPKLRTFVPIIVRGKEAEGVKFWGFGKEVYTELLGIVADADYGDITDLSSGRDIVVNHTPAVAGSDKKFPSTTIRVKPNVTRATDSKAVAELILKGQVNIFDIFAKPTYEELKSALERFLQPGEDEPATQQEKTPTVNKSTTAAQNTSKPAVSVEDDDLFDEGDDEKQQNGGDAPSLEDFDDLFEEDSK